MSISSLHGWQVKHQNKLIVRQRALHHSFEYSYATPHAIANDRYGINITLPTIKFNFRFKERCKLWWPVSISGLLIDSDLLYQLSACATPDFSSQAERFKVLASTCSFTTPQ